LIRAAAAGRRFVGDRQTLHKTCAARLTLEL
jgi:hypothetical protein